MTGPESIMAEFIKQRLYAAVFILCCIGFFVPVLADTQIALFEEGNQAYRAGNYAEALEAYKKIVDTGYDSGSLYFNMGNCHYKLGHIGKAVQYYEKAKRLIPGDEDLRANLDIANLSVVDKIEPRETFIVTRIVDFWIYLLPGPVLTIVVAVIYILTIVFLILWLITRNLTLRRFTIRMALITGILCVLFGSALIGQIAENKSHVEAVILADKVDVMSAPMAQGGTEIFVLHEGTKVEIDQQNGDWVEIILPDRKAGWVKQEVLGFI